MSLFKYIEEWAQDNKTTYKSLDFMGYPKYKVGNDGSVWSCCSGGGVYKGWHQLKSVSSCGRMLVNLNKDGKDKTYAVHRLVLFAFVGPPPSGLEGCHYDGNHKNNQLGNLRWDTPKANEADKKRHGTDNTGERNPSAKLTESDVREIRALYAEKKFSMNGLARKYGVALGTIAPLLHRQTWKEVM